MSTGNHACVNRSKFCLTLRVNTRRRSMLKIPNANNCPARPSFIIWLSNKSCMQLSLLSILNILQYRVPFLNKAGDVCWWIK